MTLQQLECFVAAARAGSFSAAADRMHVTQPAVSERVRQLEAGLGLPLFVRLGRGVRLTDAGRTLLPRAELVLRSAAEARASVLALRDLRGGTVRLGLWRTASYFGVAGVLAAFRDAHPGITIEAPGLNSSEIAGRVRAGELEAGFVVLPVDDGDLLVRPVATDEVVYVSAAAARTRAPVTLEQLLAAPLVLYDAHAGWADPTRRQLAARAQEQGRKLTAAMTVEQLEAALELAATGRYDTLVGRAVTGHRTFPPGLRCAPLAAPLFDTVALVTRAGVTPPPATRALTDALAGHLTRRPDPAGARGRRR